MVHPGGNPIGGNGGPGGATGTGKGAEMEGCGTPTEVWDTTLSCMF